VLDVAGIALQPGKAQPRSAPDLPRERDGITRAYDPGSRLPDIHIEKDRNR
jgi:hypothetical protein